MELVPFAVMGSQTDRMTISIKVELNEKEFRAIAEFAKMCGEPIPELMKKLAIRDVTLEDGYGPKDSNYEFRMVVPIESTLSLDRKTLEKNYNKIRRIMGWTEIRL
jgi:hypothetical protein